MQFLIIFSTTRVCRITSLFVYFGFVFDCSSLADGGSLDWRSSPGYALVERRLDESFGLGLLAVGIGALHVPTGAPVLVRILGVLIFFA